MKVWITKYALTKGIVLHETQSVARSGANLVFHSGLTYKSYSKPDWYESEESAKARAEEMRIKKIASLKKQIAKLEAMKF